MGEGGGRSLPTSQAAEVLAVIDAHCHLDSDRFPGGADKVVEQASAAGVNGIVMAGTTPEAWAVQSRLAARHRRVWPVYGVHPWWAARLDAGALAAAMDALAAACSGDGYVRPVAIGETGLDGSPLAPPESLGPQEASFRAHLALARRLDKPIVLHILRSHDRALRVLREVGVPDAGGMVHSYSGSAELARAYQALGLHISFCGSVARPQSRRLRAAAAATAAERLLIETDAPDQAPPPRTGELNRPAWLPVVAQAVADARADDVAAIAALTASNASRLFGLPAAGA